jgi:hypothetical protein
VFTAASRLGRPRPVVTRLAVLLLVTFMGPRPSSAVPVPAAAASLPTALLTIQSAFLSNDAARLVRLFPRRGPVFVSLPSLQVGGFLAPGPLKAFLDRLVRERVSVAFDLPAAVPDLRESQTASTFVKVKWTHRPAGSSTLHVDYLHLVLQYAIEDAEWQIVEITTSLR